MSDVLMSADCLSPRESTNQDAVQVKQSSGIESVITKSDIATCGSSSEAMQEDVLPLTGDPFFTCILMKSNVQGPFQLVVPRSFTCNLPAENVTATLCCRNRTWEIGYIGASNVKRFDAKWREFAMDNKLKIGDAAVFELTDCSSLKFRVQILDGSLPEPFRRESKGINSNTPILLDDD